MGINLYSENFYYQLEILEKQYPTNLQLACLKMLSWWLSTNEEANWKQLNDALYKTDLISAGKKIENSLKKGKVHVQLQLCVYIAII